MKKSIDVETKEGEKLWRVVFTIVTGYSSYESFDYEDLSYCVFFVLAKDESEAIAKCHITKKDKAKKCKSIRAMAMKEGDIYLCYDYDSAVSNKHESSTISLGSHYSRIGLSNEEDRKKYRLAIDLVPISKHDLSWPGKYELSCISDAVKESNEVLRLLGKLKRREKLESVMKRFMQTFSR
jgi:hypothetical protein